MPTLDREQRKIVQSIKAEGRTLPRHLRPIFNRYAVQIGLVESGLRNLNYGDADSRNFRQERESIYGDEWAKTGGPLNTRAIVKRLKAEFLQHYDPGERSYQVAAQVQRPREDLRGRYQEEAGEAARILRQTRGGGSPAGGTPGAGGPQYRTIPGVDNSGDRQQLMQQYLLERGKPQALLSLKAGLDQAQDVPERRVKIPGRDGRNKIEQTARPNAVADLKAEAELIDTARVPYQWGGGHQKKLARGSRVTPMDCSGAVSRVLGIDPRVSGQFEGWGKSGRGKRVTIYANSTHVLMEIDGHFWGTSQSNPDGGAGWIPRKQISKEYLAKFKARHPPGM